MVKTIFAITAIFALLLLAACANGVETPNSSETPAAQANNVTARQSSDIPAMTIKYLIGDALHEITAWQGVANWYFENEGGTTGGLLTDSSHPLQTVRHLPVIDRTGGEVALLDLSFEIPPDTITARRWVVDDMEKASDMANEDIDFSGYEIVYVAGKTIFVSDSDRGYVFEISANWLRQGLPESFATYAFYVTASAPVEGPRRTPQLYVRLDAEGLPIQQFRALQLSNDWFPNVIGGNGSLAGGYSASSVHPLDVWATDWLAHLEMEEDAITFQLDAAQGEIAIEFSDNFPPHTVYARRWPAEFAIAGSNMDLWSAYESVEIAGNRIRIQHDGNDYIYEIEARWAQGFSLYAFRVDSGR